MSAFSLLVLAWLWWERPTETITLGTVQTGTLEIGTVQTGASAGAAIGADALHGPARVIDGDTFVVNGVTLRLQGVDAPERSDRCLDAAGQSYACGTWATARTRQLIADQPLRCRDLGERTHGRTVAQCFLGGQDLAARLIADGIVLACPRYARGHAHSAGYEQIESVASARRTGLHAGQTPDRAAFCQPRADITVRPAAADADGVCRIKGNINRAGERIYHQPGQRDYDRTRINTAQGERWFCSEAEARAQGWRPARR